ncbi:hypothetical protein [Actinocrispum wychmicini]|uniref:Uncharacterized protein n=1 Tax=Actinocrispum wychmicini TaxID=1213861 RepID=A0A4R2JYD5_9PSEU|nr:hypothetical protein [Actinocrispum wychmicini]TCO64327.1 hypothetical protein EV192_10194 [Actinocrispum wychmicini]
MSSLSALRPVFRPSVARVGVVGSFAVFLVILGFLVPFWILLGISSVFVIVVGAVRSVRRAARTVDQILAEELSGRSTE